VSGAKNPQNPQKRKYRHLFYGTFFIPPPTNFPFGLISKRSFVFADALHNFHHEFGSLLLLTPMAFPGQRFDHGQAAHR